MTTKLSESLGFEANESKNNKWHVKVIQSGWGSSGYYGSDMLRQYGPGVFKAGTKVFMNHPSYSESSDRPERDVHQLAGKLVTDAVFREDGLFADVQFYSHYAPAIKEMFNDVGLSIHAMGNSYIGEAEGREGPIIESLVDDPLTSVDVVTVAGAGGKFVTLLESYRNKGDVTNVVAESETEGTEMSITKEEFDSAIAELKETLVDALAPLRESVSVLVEAVTPADEEAVEDETPAIDPVEVAEKFNESGLPKVALNRVAEAMKSKENTKTVEQLIESEKAYANSIREGFVSEAASVADVSGVVHEAIASSTTDEFDAVVSRIKRK
jgi:hypothetical protein